MSGCTAPARSMRSHRRRSIYFTVKRSKLVPMMQVFDAPEALTSIGDRPSTTIAPQALLLLNNPNVRQLRRAFARRLGPFNGTHRPRRQFVKATASPSAASPKPKN